MFFFMAAAVAAVVVLPIAFAWTSAYVVGARAGFFDDSSRRLTVVAAASVSGMWISIAVGWVGPRLCMRQLRPGRFSRPDSDA